MKGHLKPTSTVICIATLGLLFGCWEFSTAHADSVRDPATQYALASLATLIAKNHLELSTSSTSAADQFCFEVSINLKAKICQPFRILVVRDKDRVAMLVRATSEKCYTYCANNIIITIDHDHPGYLKCAKGSPYFIVRTNKSDEIQDMWGFDQANPTPQIILSLNDIFGIMISRATKAAYDETSKRFDLRAEHSSSSIEVASNVMNWSLKSFVMQNDEATSKITFLSCGSVSPDYASLLDPLAIENRVAKMKLRVVNHSAGEDIDRFLDGAFFVPVDFGNDPEESSAVSKWTAILMPDGVTTQPTQAP